MKASVLYSIIAILFTFGAITDSDTRKIRGMVSDESGERLIGASVLVKGTSVGTASDVDGMYEIDVPKGHDILVFSYVGFSSIEKNLGSTDTLDVTLKSSTMLCDISVVEYEVPLIGNSDQLAGKVPRIKRRSKRDGKTNLHVDGIRISNAGVPHDKGKNGRNRLSNAEYNFDNSNESNDVIVENRYQDAITKPISTFSIDVDRASYANVRRYVQRGQNPPKSAVRIEEMVNYFDYDYPQPEEDHPFSMTAEIGTCPWNKDHLLAHIGVQGKEIPMGELPASNLVFLIDVSGSMAAQNKLPLVKQSFKLLIDQLREKDRVAIAVYAGSSGLVLPPTSGTSKEVIWKALENLRSGGSTAGAAGIRLAYNTARKHFIQGGNNRVIIATDGDFNVGIRSDEEMVKLIESERKSGIFLSVLGYGMGNYKDSKMQKLADYGNGNHAYIDDLSEARKVFIHEFGGTLFTIAKDVKIQIEFNEKHIAGYRLIGYENRMLNTEDFKDDTRDAGELGSGHSVTALYELIPKSSSGPWIDSLVVAEKDKRETVNKMTPDTWFKLKMRYKKPDGHISEKVEVPILHTVASLNKTSNNFQWAAAVVAYGMHLRNSRFKGDANLDLIKTLAKNSIGRDEHGYRQAFVEMLEVSPALAKR